MGLIKELELDLQPHEEQAYFADIINTDLLQPKVYTDRSDAHLGRVYYARGAEEHKRLYFYSVTTIIENTIEKGYGFKKWLGDSLSLDHAEEYAMKAASVGNAVHALVMYLIWGEKVETDKGFYDMNKRAVVPITDKTKKRLMGFLKFAEELEPKFIATELSLYNPRKSRTRFIYEFAGTADIVARIGDKLWLIDIKTGKEYRPQHELQLTAYKILWDSLYGSSHGKIDHVGCLYLSDGWKKAPTYKLKKYNFIPDEWYKVFDIFCYLNPGDPKFRKDFPDEFELIKEKKESNNE